MADEKTFNIPLRKEWQKVPIYARTPKAVRAVRQFMQKHMKTEDVRLGRYLNEELWKRGNRRPPQKISVTAKVIEEKDEKYVKVELVGAPEEKPKEEKKKGLLEKLKGGEEKAEKEEKAEEEKKEETKEKKEIKKEEKPKEAKTKKETKKTFKKTE